MDTQLLVQKAVGVFKKYPEVKLAYLFGSAATGAAGPLSDYDFALYFDIRDVQKTFEIKSKIFNELSLELATDAIDIVILDSAKSPELKYAAINGTLLLERGDFKALCEPRILNEYFDFMYVLRRYHLTTA